MKATRKTLSFSVRVFVEPDAGGYHAWAPSLKGLHVSGDSQKEAIHNAIEAARLYLDVLIETGRPIPVGILRQPAISLLRRLVSRPRSEDVQVAVAL